MNIVKHIHVIFRWDTIFSSAAPSYGFDAIVRVCEVLSREPEITRMTLHNNI